LIAQQATKALQSSKLFSYEKSKKIELQSRQSKIVIEIFDFYL